MQERLTNYYIMTTYKPIHGPFRPLRAPTRLAIKRHAITKKLYLCKSIREDIHMYPGSGKYWKSHIKHHGTEHVEHIWNSVWFYDDSVKHYALWLSELLNVVESPDWANLCAEDGLSGGILGITDKTRQLLSERSSGKNNPMYGKKQSDESKLKSRNSQLGEKAWSYGRPKSEETKAKMSAASKGKKKSPEAIENMRLAKKNQPKDTCVHCGIVAIKANISRWHNDNCKHRH